MSVDSALNLVWALAAVVALGVFAVSERRRRRGATFTARCRRGLAVFVAAVALFPCISASDDLVRFEAMQAGLGTRTAIQNQVAANSSDKPALYLARLLEALENFQISTAVSLLAALCFFAVVRIRFSRGRDRFLPSRASRAPPFPITRLVFI